MKFSLEIVKHDEKVTINLPDGRTLGIESSSDGVLFTPDWNNRHFTWAIDEETGAPYHHITDETTNDAIAKEEYGSEDELLFDMYAGMSGFGKLKPINWVNADYLWRLDIDAYGEVLEENAVIKRSEDRLWIGFLRLYDYVVHVATHEEELAEFIERVYDPVNYREAWESDSRLFFTQGFKSFILQRPDGYVFEMSVANPVNVFNGVRGVRALDIMWQMF